MELSCNSDVLLAKRLSKVSLKEPRSPVKRAESLGKSLTPRDIRKVKKKNGVRTKEKRTESCSMLDKNCETISYRIYGNPNGEGFLIEARMHKGSEGRQDRRKRERQTVYTVYIHE